MIIIEDGQWGALIVCFALFFLVATYVLWVLPHLRSQMAIISTAWFATLSCYAATLTSGPLSLGLLGCAIALLGAQGGWLSGRRSLRLATQQVKTHQAKPYTTSKPPTDTFPSTLPAPVNDAPSVFSSTMPSPPQGIKIGPFQIDKEIGRGSMGVVYLGLDSTGQHLAIKALALGHDFDGDALAEVKCRFVREAETARRLHHCDIVSVLDAGEDQGMAYIAMEYVQGHDLQAHTRLGGLLPVTQVLHLVARVADALAYAHQQGVVHRDIKPANVMVDFSKNMVKIMDFGIAHVSDAQRTRTGLILGTPSYMSPEQLAGSTVDGRSDIYSLGVMLFQLLTGRLPHQAESMSQVLYLITNEPAPDVRSIRPELPERLAHVVAWALQKKAETRYANANEFAREVRHVANELVSCRASEIYPDHSVVMIRTAINYPTPVGTTELHTGTDFTSTVALRSPDKRHNHDV